MRQGLGILAAVLVGVLMTSLPAAAYEDVGYDPDDRIATGTPPVGGDPDIRSTIRRVERGAHGRVLVLVIKAYEDFTRWWEIAAHFDTRGGPQTDRVVQLFNNDTGPVGCSIHRNDRDRRLSFTQRGRAVLCRVPIRFLSPTKTIRWRLVSPTRYGHEGEREVAPNGGGWYT